MLFTQRKAYEVSSALHSEYLTFTLQFADNPQTAMQAHFYSQWNRIPIKRSLPCIPDLYFSPVVKSVGVCNNAFIYIDVPLMVHSIVLEDFQVARCCSIRECNILKNSFKTKYYSNDPYLSWDLYISSRIIYA